MSGKKLPPETAQDVVLIPEDSAPKGVIVITRQQLRDAEQEWLVELKLQGLTPPEHRAMDEADQSCAYCTEVSKRAVVMYLDKADGPVH